MGRFVIYCSAYSKRNKLEISSWGITVEHNDVRIVDRVGIAYNATRTEAALRAYIEAFHVAKAISNHSSIDIVSTEAIVGNIISNYSYDRIKWELANESEASIFVKGGDMWLKAYLLNKEITNISHFVCTSYANIPGIQRARNLAVLGIRELEKRDDQKISQNVGELEWIIKGNIIKQAHPLK